MQHDPSEIAASLIHEHGKGVAMRLVLEETIKAQSDNDGIVAAIAVPAITLPWWAKLFEAWMQFGIVSLTLVVVLFRAHTAWRD